jgi:hypothetical protein
MARRIPNDPNARIKFQELEVAINDLDSVVAEQNVKAALADLPGIRSVRLVRGGAQITFNPLGISQETISDAITRAGFKIDGIESSAASPQARE